VVMIPVRLRGRYCRTHSELVMAEWRSGLRVMIQASRMGCLAVNRQEKKHGLVRLSRRYGTGRMQDLTPLCLRNRTAKPYRCQTLLQMICSRIK
jgi:hypothetical protein